MSVGQNEIQVFMKCDGITLVIVVGSTDVWTTDGSTLFLVVGSTDV